MKPELIPTVNAIVDSVLSGDAAEVQACFEDLIIIDAIAVAGAAACDLGQQGKAQQLAESMNVNPIHQSGETLKLKRMYENGNIKDVVSMLSKYVRSESVAHIAMLEHYESGLGEKIAGICYDWFINSNEQV